MNWSIRTQTIAGLATVAALFLGVGVFGTMSSLAGAVVSTGQIELETHAQILQHPDGGVVAAIPVRDGDRVKAGDVLLTLEGSSLLADRAILMSQFHELEARAARLRAEATDRTAVIYPATLQDAATADPSVSEGLVGQEAVFTAALRTFTATIDGTREQQGQIHQEIAGLKAQSAALGEQIALMETEHEKAEGLLQKGLTEAPRVSELKRGLVGLIGQKAQTEAAISARLADIARLDVEIARLSSARQEKAVTELRDVEAKLTELGEQRAVLDKKIARLDLRAPLDGIVQGLTIHTIGAVLRPADPVLSVVPQDGRFTITARIDAQKVDSVFVGQEAALRFSSFDAHTTPEILGQITRISADIVTDNRTGVQFYTAEATPNLGETAKLGDKALLPGMPVEVYIQTGSHSPLAYILKPFTDYFAPAMKE
jgi:HlyD family secretion protein